jgi:hypothetical protein
VVLTLGEETINGLKRRVIRIIFDVRVNVCVDFPATRFKRMPEGYNEMNYA